MKNVLRSKLNESKAPFHIRNLWCQKGIKTKLKDSRKPGDICALRDAEIAKQNEITRYPSFTFRDWATSDLRTSPADALQPEERQTFPPLQAPEK